jgi:hypothetical protein
MDTAQAPTAGWADRYLAEIERAGVDSEYENLYLWPRTPIESDLQEVIRKRVGATDFEVDDPRSRSALIIRKLRDLRADPEAGVPEHFRLLDVACGDAVVLWQVKKAFPEAECHGIDCNKGVFPTNAHAMEQGVKLHKGYLQHLFTQSPPEGGRFDVTLMLNTYRGWESADLRDSERDLPRQADAWFERNTRFLIVTATGAQITRLRRQGWRVDELGKGEDESTMICATRPRGGSLLSGVADRLRGVLRR